MSTKTYLTVESSDNVYVVRSLINNILRPLKRRIFVPDNCFLKTSGVLNKKDIVKAIRNANDCELLIFCTDSDGETKREKKLLEDISAVAKKSYPILFLINKKIEDLLVVDKRVLTDIFGKLPNITNSKSLLNNLTKGKTYQERLNLLARISSKLDIEKLAYKNPQFKKFKYTITKYFVDFSNLSKTRKKTKVQKMSDKVKNQMYLVRRRHPKFTKDRRRE